MNMTPKLRTLDAASSTRVGKLKHAPLWDMLQLVLFVKSDSNGID